MLTHCLILLIGLLLGYIWGKHRGLYCGRKAGQAEMRLLLRQQSLEQGYCLLCNETVSTQQAYHPEKG